MAFMTFQKLPDPLQVTQVFPERKRLPLEGLYLGQRLNEISSKIGRTLVISDFLTDRNGVIAKADEQNNFRVPLELRNRSDWRLFQELMAQADVIISSEAYLKRLSAPGSQAEEVLSQFEAGGGFEQLGAWRLGAGYKRRSPDLAIVARNLDFKVPAHVIESGRRIIIFTADELADSGLARALTKAGIYVVGSGTAGVEGIRMIDHLDHAMGYGVIMMATGPSVLGLLLKANRLDLLYITEVQLEIPFEDPSTVQTILPEGKKIDGLKEFTVSRQYLQEDVLTRNGLHVSQVFSRYDKKGALSGHI
jgi:hypothetical protein